MKAITIKAPYAQLIALGLKRFETRKTKVLHSVVGKRIAIHCGKDVREFNDIRSGLVSMPPSEKSQMINAVVSGHVLDLLSSYWYDTCGYIIATTIVGDPLRIDPVIAMRQTPLERHCGYWHDNYYAYPLTDVQLLDKPIPARGNVTLWECGL